MIDELKLLARAHLQVYQPDGSPHVFVFSTPRSGSTWLGEIIWTQPGFKFCNEPLNVRNPHVRHHLGIGTWDELYADDARSSIERYFRGFCSGRLRFNDPFPLRHRYRPITHRIVFKEIHAGHDDINWFGDTFNARITYLVRHPIAVSLSREVYATLRTLLDSPYSRHFSAAQRAYAERILESGSKLERGVLAWCLQNAVPLRNARPDWVVLSYEQLALDPAPVVDRLSERLQLPRPETMLAQVKVASRSTRKSDPATQRILKQGAPDRPWLVDRWRERVNEADERRAMEILERFDLDTYHFGSSRPADSIWIVPRAESETLALA